MMMKFKVLKYHEIILLKLGVFPIRGAFKAPIIYYSILISVSLDVSLSLFVLQNTEQFDLVLRNSLFILGNSQALGMFICFYINASNVQAIHLKLQDIVDKSTATGMF